MFNKTPLLAAMALCSPSVMADLLITEYVEGSSYNKAIEITNVGRAEESLDETSLAVYFNGASTTTSRIALSGTLAAGASLVLAHPSADASISAAIRSSVINFNGDDAVVLERAGVALDTVGIVGVDPGTAYTDGSKTTLDATLRRIPGSSAGSFAFSQWQVYDKDSFDGLGCSGLNACSGGGSETPSWVCPADYLTIPSIQGEGASSPLVPAGSYESTEKVVTAGRVTQRVNGLFKGFFLQDGAGDGNPATSDGIFVYTGTTPDASIQPGVALCVEGLVKEYYGFTEIDMARFAQSEAALAPVTATELIIDPSDITGSLECVEGMQVYLSAASNMQVNRPFSYDYDASRNNMVLAYGGPLYTPTQLHPALTDAALQLAADNAARTLYIDTDSKPADGVIPYFPSLDAEQGYIRVGDRVQNLSGVLAYSYSNYRLLVDSNVTLAREDFVHLADRTDTPALAASGQLRVASFNVLNYFNDAVGGDANPLATNRGATTAAEFALQRSKIIHALRAIDADIFGLIEIENNGFGANSAIMDLLQGLNEDVDEASQYAFVQPSNGGTIGTDAITSALLYRPAKVTPVGALDILEMPNQLTTDANGAINIHHGGRPSLLQGFQRLQQGQATGEVFQIAINHLRSKGSSCAEDEEGKLDDGQGSCNELRNTEVSRLAEHVLASGLPTLLLGDFNAYANEDPILLLTQIPPLDRPLKSAHHTYLGDSTDAPLVDEQAREFSQGYGLLNLTDSNSYSYQYDGQLGRLDQALATASMAQYVVAVADWHINAAESNLFSYDSSYTGQLAKASGPFSSSDHDPVVVALQWPQTAAPASCEHQIINRWNGGFQGVIRITNQSNTDISDWQVQWHYRDGSQLQQLWNGQLSGNGPYLANGLSWNNHIAPQQTVEVGFIGSGDGDASAVTGAICSAVVEPPLPVQGEAECSYQVVNAWPGGFQGSVRISNTSASTIRAWQLTLAFADGSSISHSWNTQLSGNGPYDAVNLDWNRTLDPGSSIEFGFTGSGAGQLSSLTGGICR